MKGNPKKIAIYGKGGIGKSTTVSNVAAALASLGYTVMQIGCDPKSDSTISHAGGKRLPTVLDTLRDKGDATTLEDIVYHAPDGVYCVESGGPTPGVGCAGRGIIAAFEALGRLGAFERYQPDVILYDVLGDVVCGGFAMPIRGGYAEDVYIVTSGEMMSMYAATNISQAIGNFRSKGYARLRGLIVNEKGVEDEQNLTEKLSSELSCPITARIPRDKTVQGAEALGQTVIGAFPESSLAETYRGLARALLEGR